MKIETFSHCEGDSLVDPEIKSNVLKVLDETNFRIHHGCANKLRKLLLSQLKRVGWSGDFMLDANSQISLTSYNDEHVLCFQTGNMSRFYADMIKLQYVYQNRKAKGAIYLIPSKEAAKKMGSNIAHFTRFTSEISLFKDIITIPTLVIGIS